MNNNIFKIIREANSSNQAFGLIETMVAIFIIAVVGLGMSHSLINSMQYSQKFRIREAAESMARSQLEIYSMKNPNSLLHDTNFDVTENNLTYPSLSNVYKFNRFTDVNLGAGNTIEVTVTVTCTHLLYPVTFEGAAIFAQW